LHHAQTPVAQLVLDHSECAKVLQRHRIDYCCKGHLPLEQACRERGADLVVVARELQEAIARREGGAEDVRGLSNQALVARIVDVHHRYLREVLPFLQPLSSKVARVHGHRHPSLLRLRDAVHALAEALEPHLEREEQILFAQLLSGAPDEAVIAAEAQAATADHQNLGALLEQVRSHAGDFRLPEGACASYTTLFRELEALEADVVQHLHLEAHVLLPRFARATGAGG
jgi:regulator of cell morphogenesis and NO signaling